MPESASVIAPRFAAAKLGPETGTGSELPLAIDLYCGLGGWTEGFLAEGYRVVGFDIERHRYPGRNIDRESKGFGGTWFHNAKTGRTNPNRSRDSGGRLTGEWVEYPGDLVIQDVLTIHGSQFKDAACIVASPPCQKYSYLAMPWSRSTSEHSQAAKALRRKWETEGPDNRLFDACFRIQREASEAAGHHIPLVVENVRGAQPWVGRAAWSYGSFFLWGDVPALMPINLKRGGKGTKPFEHRGWTQGCAITLGLENYNGQKRNPDGTNHPSGSWFRIADSSQGDRGPARFDAHGNEQGSWFRRTQGRTLQDDFCTNPEDAATNGTKIGGDWFSDPKSTCRKHGSRSAARKAASAQIAKIPFELARWVAQVYKPRGSLAQETRLRFAAGKS